MPAYGRSCAFFNVTALLSLVYASFLMALLLHTCALGVAEARQPFDATVVSQSSWTRPEAPMGHYNLLGPGSSTTVMERASAGDDSATRRKDGDDNGLAKALSDEPDSNKINWSNRMIGKPISIRNFRDRQVLATGSFVSNFTITTSLHMPPGSSTGLVRIVAIDLETADKYLMHLGDDFFIQQAPIQNANAMYAFLERALIASKPGPVDEQDEPNSDANAIPCGLWTVIDGSSQTPVLHIEAVMTYDHEWLKPLRVVLDVPRVQKGSPEDKYTLEMQKMREGFEARQAEFESQMRIAVDEMKTTLMRNVDSAGGSRAELEELRSAVDILKLQANNIITIRGFAIPMDATSLTNRFGSSTYTYLKSHQLQCQQGEVQVASGYASKFCSSSVTLASSW